MAQLIVMEKTRLWYAIRTKSRHEKITYHLMAEKGADVFLPLRKEIHQWSDRKKEVEVPLFPGYLFVRCLRSELKDIFYTRGVAHIVGGLEGEEHIPEEQVESIRKLLASSVPFEVHPYIKKGINVRIKRGPLKNCYGRIVRTKGKDRLLITVDLIARAVSAEVSLYDVEPM